MSTNTTVLGLYKKDPLTDGNDTFDIKTMMNDNWDKIDEFAGEIKKGVKSTPTLTLGTNTTIRNNGQTPIFPYIRIKGRHYVNLLAPYGAMNKDSNADGVVDGFTKTPAAGNTDSFIFDSTEKAQKIDITSSTTTNNSNVYIDVACSAGDVISARCETKISGNVRALIQIQWYNGAAYLSYSNGDIITSTSYAESKVENATAPANTTKARVTLLTRPLVIGNTGSAWFKNAMLVKDSAIRGNFVDSYGALTNPYLVNTTTGERFMLEGQFTDDDTIIIDKGKVSGMLNWKHRTLYGKDYDWQFESSYAGYKRIRLTAPELKGQNIPAIVVKYDGKILVNKPYGIANTSGDEYVLDDRLSNGFITISNTDSGWLETVNPNSDEVKANRNGWKAVANNGTRYIAWVSAVDGSIPSGSVNTLSVGTNASGQKTLNVTTGTGTQYPVGRYMAVKHDNGSWQFYTIASNTANSVTFVENIVSTISANNPAMLIDDGSTNLALLNYCKNNVAPNYQGDRLHYKLANPEPITDINVPLHGNLWSLVPGDNYVTVDSGWVLGEVANPVLSSGNYYIDDSTLTGSLTRFKNETIGAIYKNLNPDSWTIDTTNTYGNKRAYLLQANFDPNATYTVDYQILKTLHAQVAAELYMEFIQDLNSSVESIAKAVEGKQEHSSTLDNINALALYERVGKVLFVGRCTQYSNVNDIRYVSSIRVIPKKTIPIVTITDASFMYFTGSGVAQLPDCRIEVSSVGIDYLNLRLIYYGSDTTIKSALLNYGITSSCSVILDCRGRV